MSHQICYGLKARVTTPVLSPAAAALLGLCQGAKLLCSLQTLVKKVVSLLLSCNSGNGAKELLHTNTWSYRPESYTLLGCQVCECSP